MYNRRHTLFQDRSCSWILRLCFNSIKLIYDKIFEIEEVNINYILLKIRKPVFFMVVIQYNYRRVTAKKNDAYSSLEQYEKDFCANTCRSCNHTVCYCHLLKIKTCFLFLFSFRSFCSYNQADNFIFFASSCFEYTGTC